MKSKTRGDERGAALFIVVMVTVLLGAIGVFAVRAASLVEVASGYSRLFAQAGYVSEFAARAVAADMAGREDEYFQCIAHSGSRCRAVRQLYETGVVQTDAPIACCARLHTEMQARFERYDLSNFNSTEKLLQHVMRPKQEASGEAAFRVELTDLGPAPDLMAGRDVRSGHYMQATITSTGQVRPSATGNACTEDVVQASGIQAARSHVTFVSNP